MRDPSFGARAGARVAVVRSRRRPTVVGTLARTPLLSAFWAFALWTLATYLLEGRIRTLLRPGATIDRLVYALVANVLVGTVLALGVARLYVTSGALTPSRLGFRRPGRTAVAVPVAGLLGLVIYVASGPPSTDPVVVANVYAQVLTVSVAEVVVCWVVVGGAVYAAVRPRGERVATVAVVVVAAVAFGAYHVAHSPPFDAPGTIATLTLVGLGTGIVYVGGGDVYGTVAFHSSMGLVGVTRALAASGGLTAYRQPLPAVLGTALLSLVVLVAADLGLIRRSVP